MTSLARIAPLLLLLLCPSLKPQAQKVASFRCEAGEIRMYSVAPDGRPWGSFGRLVAAHPEIRFGTNGGMYDASLKPSGVYIENGKMGTPMRRVNNPRVNFGIQPQGVFGIRAGKAFVETVESYKSKGVRYATQSAPMLVLGGARNGNLPVGLRLIRNGVGLLPDGRVLLAVSEEPVTFHQFADWFIGQGCTTALYLDGNVSEYYKPGHPSYGKFGVLVAVEDVSRQP